MVPPTIRQRGLSGCDLRTCGGKSLKRRPGEAKIDDADAGEVAAGCEDEILELRNAGGRWRGRGRREVRAEGGRRSERKRQVQKSTFKSRWITLFE